MPSKTTRLMYQLATYIYVWHFIISSTYQLKKNMNEISASKSNNKYFECMSKHLFPGNYHVPFQTHLDDHLLCSE